MATFQATFNTTDTDDPIERVLPEAPPRVEDPTAAQQAQLADRAREFASRVLADSRHAGAVDVDDIEWTVSTNDARSRRAGHSSATVGPDGVQDREISLTWAAFEAWGWGKNFEGVVRHELAHHVDYSRRGESGHDLRYEMVAQALDAPLESPRFYGDHRLRVFCGEGCEDVRNRACKVVKYPDEIHEGGAPEEGRCAEHGETWAVEHTATGRQWADEAGYRAQRAAIEEAAGEEW